MADSEIIEKKNQDQDPSKLINELFEQIKSATIDKNFTLADSLREQLINEFPTALTEIIKSAGIIEEAKSASIDRDHLAIWDDLYQDLSEEETNCLFYSLKSATIPPKKRILSHGAYNNKLFLIDKGQVTVFYPKDGKNIMLANLGRGDLLGEYTFSTISLCSASVASTSEVHLKYLESSTTEHWQEEQPVLLNKLISYCHNKGKIDQIIKQKEMEKRSHARYKQDGAVKATLLTKEGKKTDTFVSGSLSNISQVGCCYEVLLSKKEMARAILAKHFYYEIEIELGGKAVRFPTLGKVVRVSFHLHSDYSVHVRFVKPLDEKLIGVIAKYTNQ